MANKKYNENCGGLKPIMHPRMKGDNDPTKSINDQKKTSKKTTGTNTNTTTKKKVKRKK